MLDPKRIVADGYDEIAERHAAWASHTRAQERERYVALLMGLLPAGAALLDLGCGAGANHPGFGGSLPRHRRGPLGTTGRAGADKRTGGDDPTG
jgi:hypothetical protein